MTVLASTIDHFRKRGAAFWFAVRLLFRAAPLLCLTILLVGIGPGFLPPLQIQVTTRLVNALVQHLSAAHASTPGAIFNLGTLQPYLLWLALLLVILIVQNLANALQPYLSTLLDERVKDRLLTVFYRKVVSLPLAEFENVQTYDSAARAFASIDKFSYFWQEYLQGLLTACVSALSILAAFISMGQSLVALILLLGYIPLLYWGARAYTEVISINYGQTSQRRRLNYWRGLLTMREAAAETRLYGLKSYIRDRWPALSERLITELEKARLRNTYNNIVQIAMSVGLLGASLLLLLFAAMQHKLSPGAFVALLLALQQFQQQAGSLNWRLFEFQEAITEIGYLPGFLALPEEDFRSDAASDLYINDGISFEQVAFSYPGTDRPVLYEINLHIRRGEHIALVGENGAGKSTLAKLLLGLYQPTAGRITVNGVDLREIEPDVWRRRCAAVFQDFVKYQLTARENIGFGEISQLENIAAIRAVAAKSGADAMIEPLAEQYETMLGRAYDEHGHELSYGQWQKLAIARAYLRDAQVLVLDEPTAALDAKAERQFRDVSRNKSALLISHRLGCTRLADRILFLRNGRVIEEGTHDELLALGGAYAEMLGLQAQWYV